VAARIISGIATRANEQTNTIILITSSQYFHTTPHTCSTPTTSNLSHVTPSSCKHQHHFSPFATHLSSAVTLRLSQLLIFLQRNESATHAHTNTTPIPSLAMVQEQGISVYIVRYSDGSRYREYPVPTSSPSYTGNRNEVYIEAVDGERFIIIADTCNESDTEGSERLQISCQVDSGDDSAGPWRCGFARPQNVPSKSTVEGRYIHRNCERQIQDGGVTYGYTFVPLQIGTFCPRSLPVHALTFS
jgi:hypothetical protein